MKIKKFFSMLLVLAITLGITPVLSLTVEAAEYDTDMPFEDYIIAHLENFESEIDILDYAIKNGWDEKYAKNLFIDTLNNNPQIFFVKKENNLSYSYSEKYKKDSSTGEIYDYTRYLSKLKITGIKYTIIKSEYAKQKKALDKAINKALTVVNDSMKDWEKALAIHDYLILNMSYDKKEFDYLTKNNKQSNPNAYTMYGALINKIAVCEGYSAAYKYLLNQLGIECTVIKSEKMVHVWNYVKLDGKWYHADLTWDDPLFNNQYDLSGGVLHKHFLVSDARIKTLEHKDWDTNGLPAAKSTTYNNYFWKNIETGLFNSDGLWYWIELDTTSPAYNKNYEKLSKSEYNDNFYKMYSLIKSYNPETKKKSTVHKFYSTWFTWGTENANIKNWVSKTYARLAIYNGNIYYNTAKELCVFNLTTKKSSVVFTPKNMNGYIYGFSMDGKKITYTVKQKTAQEDNFFTKSV